MSDKKRNFLDKTEHKKIGNTDPVNKKTKKGDKVEKVKTKNKGTTE